jgi:energy-coupling factor transport system ATP-binding protein
VVSALIEIAGLQHRILEIPSIEFGEGHTVIIGANGSGKTTLLELCAGIQRPQTGTVLIDGLPPRECTVGRVCEFPERNFIFERVFDEIASPLRFRHRRCDAIGERVMAVAEAAGICDLLSHSTQELSGGEKVLVALATALAPEPQVLILDETDSHLDRSASLRIRCVIEDCPASYILQSTHSMDAAVDAQCVLFLEGGRVESCGAPKDVFCGREGTCWYPPVWRYRR